MKIGLSKRFEVRRSTSLEIRIKTLRQSVALDLQTQSRQNYLIKKLLSQLRIRIRRHYTHSITNILCRRKCKDSFVVQIKLFLKGWMEWRQAKSQTALRYSVQCTVQLNLINLSKYNESAWLCGFYIIVVAE